MDWDFGEIVLYPSTNFSTNRRTNFIDIQSNGLKAIVENPNSSNVAPVRKPNACRTFYCYLPIRRKYLAMDALMHYHVLANLILYLVENLITWQSQFRTFTMYKRLKAHIQDVLNVNIEFYGFVLCNHCAMGWFHSVLQQPERALFELYKTHRVLNATDRSHPDSFQFSGNNFQFMDFTWISC